MQFIIFQNQLLKNILLNALFQISKGPTKVCNSCARQIDANKFQQHINICGLDIEQEEEKKEDFIDDVQIKCPQCGLNIRRVNYENHLEACLIQNESKECTICKKRIKKLDYIGHYERCKKRTQYKNVIKQHEERKKQDYLTESMLQDPNIGFLQCIYCQRDIVESRYQEHLLICETEKQCEICRHSYPEEIYQDHLMMCRIKALMSLDQGMVQCQKCQQIVPTRFFEQHQMMHFEEEGYDQVAPQQQQLSTEAQQKINSLLNDPNNQRINNMTDDELYKYFHEIDLNEFQKNSGISKQDLKSKMQSTFYKQSDNSKEEDRTCLICQDDFQNLEKIRNLPCSHRFHEKCVDEWLSRNAVCPICRKDIKSELEKQNINEIIEKNQKLQIIKNNSNNSNASNNNNMIRNPNKNFQIKQIKTKNTKIIQYNNQNQNKSPSNRQPSPKNEYWEQNSINQNYNSNNFQSIISQNRTGSQPAMAKCYNNQENSSSFIVEKPKEILKQQQQNPIVIIDFSDNLNKLISLNKNLKNSKAAIKSTKGFSQKIGQILFQNGQIMQYYSQEYLYNKILQEEIDQFQAQKIKYFAKSLEDYLLQKYDDLEKLTKDSLKVENNLIKDVQIYRDQKPDFNRYTLINKQLKNAEDRLQQKFEQVKNLNRNESKLINNIVSIYDDIEN
ncbi:hypothetical protein PPERSA_03470 [Pseudocohnilembus persalinus]|uniref:RING-type domain-containing protein n=1 Tax=Pseudocohnilembus persalinus TaxID=266149 RepID=A0A0V0QBR9_PSEPJ|nr:hypothetical protein PPERSA_03470 [Pseudocohnilembus persalinus]|eukprot:KRW99669.1 hypothetical protein PPERSA_03470 [Pseudocohnilembus persalinus]